MSQQPPSIPEEGELAPSVHSTQDSPSYLFRPPQSICRGITRASDPNPTVFRLADFEKVEKIGEGTFG
jgi:hypothetical protein